VNNNSTDEQRKLATLAWLMSVASSAVNTPEGRRFYITITPEVAKTMLSHLAPNQRRPKSNQVRRLVDDLVHKRWARNGDCIRYNIGLWLWDGQHRCLAVIESGIPLESYPVLVCNDAEVEMTFDTGLTIRSSQDMTVASGDELEGLTGTRMAALIYEHCDFVQQRVNALSKLARLEIARRSPMAETIKLLSHKVVNGLSRGVRSVRSHR